MHSITWHSAAAWDYLSLFTPAWLPLTLKVTSWGGDTCNVCMHLRMKQFPALGHSRTCTACHNVWNSSNGACRDGVSHWCAWERRHSRAADWGGYTEEQMNRQRVDQSALYQDAGKSSSFPSRHAGEVCEILFEVHRCAHFKVHLTRPECIPPETGRGDTGFLSGGTMGNRTHVLSYTQSRPSAVSCTACGLHPVET